MKPNNASEGMRLRVETANEKLKQDAQTRDANGMQTLSVLGLSHIRSLTHAARVVMLPMRAP